MNRSKLVSALGAAGFTFIYQVHEPLHVPDVDEITATHPRMEALPFYHQPDDEHPEAPSGPLRYPRAIAAVTTAVATVAGASVYISDGAT
jgi:hypothetical protein